MDLIDGLEVGLESAGMKYMREDDVLLIEGVMSVKLEVSSVPGLVKYRVFFGKGEAVSAFYMTIALAVIISLPAFLVEQGVIKWSVWVFALLAVLYDLIRFLYAGSLRKRLLRSCYELEKAKGRRAQSKNAGKAMGTGDES